MSRSSVVIPFASLIGEASDHNFGVIHLKNIGGEVNNFLGTIWRSLRPVTHILEFFGVSIIKIGEQIFYVGKYLFVKFKTKGI